MEMTGYQIAMLVIAILGFLVTWTTGIIALTRAVEKIKADTSEKINIERSAIIERLDELSHRFDEDQKTQDHNFGEVGSAMRQYIADVEKKVREVEIFGRDNYVRIPDFEKAIDRMSDTFKEAIDDLKKDMRALLTKQ